MSQLRLCSIKGETSSQLPTGSSLTIVGLQTTMQKYKSGNTILRLGIASELDVICDLAELFRLTPNAGYQRAVKSTQKESLSKRQLYKTKFQIWSSLVCWKINEGITMLCKFYFIQEDYAPWHTCSVCAVKYMM